MILFMNKLILLKLNKLTIDNYIQVNKLFHLLHLMPLSQCITEKKSLFLLCFSSFLLYLLSSDIGILYNFAKLANILYSLLLPYYDIHKENVI